MPAKIIESLDGRSRDHWIEHENVRVGKGSYEISLGDPSLTGHVLSVLYDDEKYFVYNRGDTSAKLGKSTLSYNTRTVWPPGTPIRIGRTELHLEIVGDPKPAPRPAFADVLDTKGVSEELLRPESTGKKKKKMDSNALINVLIVLGMILAGGLFFAATQLGGPEEPQVDATELEKILAAVDEEWTGDPKHDQMRQCFQLAFAAETRKRPAEAYAYYQTARDLILKRMAQKKLTEPYGKDVKLLSYTKRQLQRLSSFAR
jgi:hypothetical protein